MARTKTTAVFAFLGMMAIGLTTLGVEAHKGASGVVKQRMDAMKALAAEMKALGRMASGRAPYDAAKAQAAARALQKHAQDLPTLFPKGSTQHPSQSKPEVWTRWPEFSASFKDLEKHAMALEKAANDPKATQPPKPIIRQLGRTCSSCHKVFRKPKK